MAIAARSQLRTLFMLQTRASGARHVSRIEAASSDESAVLRLAVQLSHAFVGEREKSREVRN